MTTVEHLEAACLGLLSGAAYLGVLLAISIGF